MTVTTRGTHGDPASNTRTLCIFVTVVTKKSPYEDNSGARILNDSGDGPKLAEDVVTC